MSQGGVVTFTVPDPPNYIPVSITFPIQFSSFSVPAAVCFSSGLASGFPTFTAEAASKSGFNCYAMLHSSQIGLTGKINWATFGK